MRISDWSSDVCSSDLEVVAQQVDLAAATRVGRHVGSDALRRHQRRVERNAAGVCRRVAFVQRGVEQQRVRRECTTVVLARNVIEDRSDEHTSELQSLLRISYAAICLKKQTYHH